MKINEDNYLSQMRLRNEKALVWVIDEYSGFVTAIVKKRLYALPQYQEECVNDIFLGVWSNIECYDEQRSSFRNWIAGISRYKAISYLRKYMRELKTRDINNLEIASSTDVIEKLTENEISKETEQMLSCLELKDRELFEKLYLEDKSFDEVSRELGIEKPVIYNRVSRGKKKIRKLFSAREGSRQ